MTKRIPWAVKGAIIGAVITAIAVIIAAWIGILPFRGGPELVTVQGVVTDNDRNLIKNAVVEIDGLSVITGVDGRYVINNVPVGTKTITVRTPGAEVVKRALKISKGNGIMTYDIVLPSPVIPTLTHTPSPTPSPTPPVEPYMVYSDNGIAGGDAWVWSGADWGLESPPLVDGSYVTSDTPEGTTCFAVTSGSGHGNYVGWGVFLGIFNKKHELITPHTVDLSDYESLEFWTKTPIDLKVEIQQDNSNGKKSSPCFISNYGWNSSLPGIWHKVTIPKSAFRNVDLTKIFCPFMITGKGNKITFCVDKVMWIPRKANETK